MLAQNIPDSACGALCAQSRDDACIGNLASVKTRGKLLTRSGKILTLFVDGRVAVDGPKDYRSAVVGQQAFEEPLLDLLQDGSICLTRPSQPEGQAEVGAAVQGLEEEAIWGILRSLYRHCLAEVPRGWLLLQRGLCRLRYGLALPCRTFLLPYSFATWW
jgi:hypothetical protein